MVKIFKKKDELSHYFAEMIRDGVSKTPEGEHYSIALSGGSTPRAVFDYIATNHKHKVNWDKLIVFWGDERCVPPESDESNFGMAKESLLRHVPIPEENIFRIQGESDPEEEAERYSELIRKEVGIKNGTPRFDLILLGLGTDGHTASIFPEKQHLFESEKLCEAVQHPETSQARVTFTGKLINHAKLIVYIVTGESKAEKVATIIERKSGWEELPASKVDPKDGQLIWLLDGEAAADLKN